MTISYVGADQLLPLAPRRAALKAQFEFHCSCPRCAAEEALGPSIATAVEEMVQVGLGSRRTAKHPALSLFVLSCHWQLPHWHLATGAQCLT